jgi:hypothetical protein
MLRNCFPTKDSAEKLYRRLQADMQDRPTPDRCLLMAWWEKMLGHDREAVMALEQVMEALPTDMLIARLHEDWSALLDTDAPPAAQP